MTKNQIENTMIKIFERIVKDNNETLFFLPGCQVYDVGRNVWKKMADRESSDSDYCWIEFTTIEDVISMVRKAVEGGDDTHLEVVTVVRSQLAYDTASKVMIVAGPDTTPGAEAVHWFD